MQPFARQGLLRRGGPFAAVALLAFAMTPLPPVTDGARVAGAVGLTLAILAAAVLVPWRRLPAGAVVLPPLAYFVVVALLRDADGGSRSGAGVLVALPVLWLALHGGRGQLLAAAGGAGLTFVVPLLVVGAPRYTAVDVEHGVFAVAVMLLIGLTVQDLVSRVRHQASELEELSRTDPLTGLGNRREWDQELPAYFVAAGRSGAPLSVVMMDVDLNGVTPSGDDDGDPAGDRLLKEVSSAWASQVRQGDLLVRFGADEFAMALPGAGEEAAAGLVERLKGVIPEGRTASVGVASWNRQEPAEAVVARADAALDEARARGRDRTIIAP